MLNKLFNHDSAEREDGLVPIAKVSDLAIGQLKRVTVRGQSIVVTLVAQEGNPGATDVVAFTSMCPHSMGDLSQGWMDDDGVNCPMHYYRFNVRTGVCTYPKGGPKLMVFPVTVEGNQVFARVEQPKWMDASDD
jgi:nitrite reductase/ring-hydroxylating ferredoxin subunit